MSRRSDYTQTDLAQAVAKVKRGMSLRQASKETNVPPSTIKDHARGKYMDNKQTKKGGIFALDSSEETAIINYIQYMGERGFPLTRKVVKKLVVDVVKESGRAPRINLEKGPSNKWMKRFLKRHPQVSLRTPHPLEKDRSAVNQGQIDQYYELLDQTLVKLGIKDDPTRIFNFDETGFSGKEHGKQKIVMAKGVKHPYQPSVAIGEHVTLQLAISAAGKVIAPLVIFSKNLPRNDYTDGIPDDWSFAASDLGYITNELFQSWFTECFIKQCGKARPVLVVMDNHVTHLNKSIIDVAQQEHIELLCLPAHSTHLLQPLDVGYYHLLKANMSELCTSLGYTGMKTIPRHKFPKILHLGINKIPGSSASASFAGVGICPFNSKKVKVESSKYVRKEKNTTVECEVDACETCGHISKENQLVKLGLIPSALKDILVEPEQLLN